MIAIPNTEKPKDCWDCFNYNCGHWGTHGYDFAETDCPLIEIVRCEDCKHLEVINKAPIYAHCHKWDYDFELWQEDTRRLFCSYGERRADE